jgi:hypothetical protein
MFPRPRFDRPLRTALACWLAMAVGLALTGVVAAAIHAQTRQMVAFMAVAIVLSIVVVLAWRNVTWVLAVCLLAGGGQVFAIVGIIWELTQGVATVKAEQLRAIGLDPRLGVSLNLAFSAIGFALFCWSIVRWNTAQHG